LKLLIIVSSILLPLIMFYLQNKSRLFRISVNIIAIMATIIAGSIVSTAIVQVLIDDEVFMTTIHAILLNPLFLITGAYLGIFIIYRLLMLTVNERNHE